MKLWAPFSMNVWAPFKLWAIFVGIMPAHKKADSERNECFKTIRATKAEVEKWDEMAKQEGVPFAVWAREWLNWAVAQGDRTTRA